MKCNTLTMTLGLLITAQTWAAGSTINPSKQYPKFQIGATGIWATIEPGLKITVDSTAPDTPAAGALNKGDVLVSINGRSLDVQDPREPLGYAISDAEGKDGKVAFKVESHGKSKQVVITIPVLGQYSRTWPLNCTKSRKLIKANAERLANSQTSEGWFVVNGRTQGAGLTGCMMAMFLMSTGNEAYMPNVKRYVYALAKKVEPNPTYSSWHLGYQLIVMGEYYLKTGDKTVIPAMTVLAAKTAEGQIAGSWGHSMNDTAVGYVQSGQMNSAGVTVFLGLAIARECGITVSEPTFQKALVFFYRMPGHGSICYGDHRSEIYIDTNGRNAAIACAMHVLQGEVYQMAAEHLAMLIADSYCEPEAGHTGGGFNIIWRGIATMLLPPDQQYRYRRHMEQLRWYYDLCRLPDNTFQILPSTSTRYSSADWGYSVGLTYTAPLKNLRITGGPPTQYSVLKPLPALPWGTPRDTVFLQSDYCAGYGEEDEPPHVIYDKVHGKDAVPVAYAAKQMRHFSPMIRTWAAYKLTDHQTDDAYEALLACLTHRDPRVRRAGCDAISSYTNWGRGRRKIKVPLNVMSEKMMPAIEHMLDDPDAAWWEIDGALWALGFAKPEDIRRNMSTIKTFSHDREWYLREAAYWAVVGLGTHMTPEEFLYLGDQYLRSVAVFERSSYDGGINYLLRSARLQLDDETIASYVRMMGKALHSALLESGYDPVAARHEATHRIMMTLERFKESAPQRLIIPDYLTYLNLWEPGIQHSNWLITGNGWQRGLCKIALELGPDGRALIQALRNCQKKLPAPGKREDKQVTEVRAALAKTLAEYDQKYGR